MKLAQISNNIVVNIIEVTENSIPSWAVDWPEAGESSIGWEYIDGVLSEPQIDPSELLAEERSKMKCTRAQGKMAIGSAIWASVLLLAEDPETPWALKVAIEDTTEWERLNPNMVTLIWAMQLTDEEADDLFRLAMTL